MRPSAAASIQYWRGRSRAGDVISIIINRVGTWHRPCSVPLRSSVRVTVRNSVTARMTPRCTYIQSPFTSDHYALLEIVFGNNSDPINPRFCRVQGSADTDRMWEVTVPPPWCPLGDVTSDSPTACFPIRMWRKGCERVEALNHWLILFTALPPNPPTCTRTPLRPIHLREHAGQPHARRSNRFHRCSKHKTGVPVRHLSLSFLFSLLSKLSTL